MNFGLFMMPLHPPHRAFADAYQRDVDQIVLADRLGFLEAWIGEHLTERWENAPAPDLLIAQALALTKNIRLGTGVTLLALHQPVYLAHRIAMLDHLARGRFQWGIGGGAIPTDQALLGLDPATLRARSAEVLEVVLALWAADGRPNRLGTIQMTTTKLDPAMPDEAVTVDYLMEHVWIVGDPSEVAEKMHRLYDESGGFGTLLSITTDADDASWDHESLRLLVEDVGPRVARLT